MTSPSTPNKTMPNLNPAYIKRLKSFAKTSLFSRHMNLELVHIQLDQARIRLILHPHHLQPFGIVHGGVLATLIDMATFWSAFLRLPQGTGLVNLDLKLNYLVPATKGQLMAKGHCLKSGGTIQVARASVVDSQGGLIAHGTSTLMALAGKGPSLGVNKFLP